MRRARDGSDQPFKVVGWDGSTEDHPVGKEVLARVGAAARGTEIHKALKAAPGLRVMTELPVAAALMGDVRERLGDVRGGQAGG